MLKEKKYIFGVLLIIFLLLFTGCSVRKNVRNKEVKEFTKSILESNEKVKDLSFYFLRPSLYSDLVYDGELEKEDFQKINDEFNKKIDIEFMQRIGDEYWGGSRPSEFNLYIHVDKNRSDKKKHTYDYKISSQYNKTFVHDEEPDNIDGYETWHISGGKDSGIIIDLGEDEATNVALDFLITPEGLRIHSNSQLEELNEIEAKAKASIEAMNEKYDDITKMSEEDLEIQVDIVNQVMDRLDSGKVIEDKATIENIFNQLKDHKGIYVNSFEGEVIAKIQLIEDPETESVISIDNAYIREFILLKDGNILIPKGIMLETSGGLEATGKMEYIKVTLTENLKYELEKLAKD